MQKLGIYIHWPFCLSKCPYCGFFSRVQKKVPQAELIKEYLADLAYYRSLNDNYRVESIFFGGGTPSLLEPQHIAAIIDKVQSLWSCADDLEISLEANPNSNHPNLFTDLKSAGINRLSLGVQALKEEDLKFLGRTHSLQDAYQAIDSVLKNFDNHSMDLIYARPKQSPALWEQELQQAAKLGFKHLSLYQLMIDEETAFAKKGVKVLEDEPACELYELSGSLLKKNGYNQYEISNYAKTGFECRHNLGYWHGDDYVGVGNGAIGYLHHQDKIFMTSHPRILEEVSPQERAEELVIMGLRLNEGIDKKLIPNPEKLEKLKAENLLEENGNKIRVTSEGRLLLDYVIVNLLML